MNFVAKNISGNKLLSLKLSNPYISCDMFYDSKTTCNNNKFIKLKL